MSYEQKEKYLTILCYLLLIIGFIFWIGSLICIIFWNIILPLSIMIIGAVLVCLAMILGMFLLVFQDQDNDKLHDGKVSYPNVTKLFLALQAYNPQQEYFNKLEEELITCAKMIDFDSNKSLKFEKLQIIKRILVDGVTADRKQKYIPFAKEFFENLNKCTTIDSRVHFELSHILSKLQ